MVSGSRVAGQVNHSLYLAKILLGSWAMMEAKEDVASKALLEAFEPGIRQHLVSAYGWFLLELTDQERSADLPRSTAEVASASAVPVLTGELREFARLEQSGWLRDLLVLPSPSSSAALAQPAMGSSPRHSSNTATIAVTTVDGVDRQTLGQWHETLSRTIERMRDSLDEC